jgi:hypothetical protein
VGDASCGALAGHRGAERCGERAPGSSKGKIAAGQLGANPRLVDMPNDDAAPVNVGADAASQLHIVEKDYGHALLAL